MKNNKDFEDEMQAVLKAELEFERQLKISKKEAFKEINNLIDVKSVKQHLKELEYWKPEGIVEILENNAINDIECARIKDSDDPRIFRKQGEKGIDHIYIWQTTGYLGDDYSGWILLPLSDGRYWKIYYNC